MVVDVNFLHALHRRAERLFSARHFDDQRAVFDPIQMAIHIPNRSVADLFERPTFRHPQLDSRRQGLVRFLFCVVHESTIGPSRIPFNEPEVPVFDAKRLRLTSSGERPRKTDPQDGGGRRQRVLVLISASYRIDEQPHNI